MIKRILVMITINTFLFFGCQSLSNSESEPKIPVSEKADNSQKMNVNNASIANKLVDAHFEKNRKLWLEKNITNYNLTVSIMTYGFTPTPEPVLIEVRDGQVVSTKLLSKPQPGSLEIYSTYETIDKIFGEIQKNLSKYEKSMVHTYNKTFGYPEKTTFGEPVIDGLYSVTIKKFEVIEKKKAQ